MPKQNIIAKNFIDYFTIKEQGTLHNWSNYRRTDTGHLPLMGIPLRSEEIGEQPFRICSAANSILNRYPPTHEYDYKDNNDRYETL
jgi:hypothetical protein